MKKIVFIAVISLSHIKNLHAKVNFVYLLQTSDTTSCVKPIITWDYNKYIHDNLQYPADAKAKEIQGAVIVNFQIDASGNVSGANVPQSVFPSLDAEAIRLVNNMPKWIPAMKNGMPINATHSVSVSFKLY